MKVFSIDVIDVLVSLYVIRIARSATGSISVSLSLLWAQSGIIELCVCTGEYVYQREVQTQ